MLFFKDLSIALNCTLDKYENVIVMGDINIDTLNKQDTGYNSLGSFSDVYGLSNLVTTNTCFTKNSCSDIAQSLSVDGIRAYNTPKF